MKRHPKRGDTVKLKGRIPSGVLKTMNDESLSCCVDWFNDDGPKYCHLYELEVIEKPILQINQEAE